MFASRLLSLVFLSHVGWKQGVFAIDCSDVALSCSDAGDSTWTYQYGLSSKPSGYNNQEADLYIPSNLGSTSSKTPVVVLIHGAYGTVQRNTPIADLEPLAEDLTARGYAAVRFETRLDSDPTPDNGIDDAGGFPGTFNDLVTGIDALKCIAQENLCGSGAAFDSLDLDKIVVVGHSAGGHLALWRALQAGLSDADRATFDPNIIVKAELQPVAAIGLSGISNMTCFYAEAIWDFMNSGTQTFEPSYCEYEPFESIRDLVSPTSMLQAADAAVASSPIQIMMVHPVEDGTVPFASAQFFVSACGSATNIQCQLYEYEGGPGSHVGVINAGGPGWTGGAIPFLESVAPAEEPVVEDNGICFAIDSSTVEVKGKGAVNIMEVALNDLVLSDFDGTYSRVYAFGHRSHSHRNKMTKIEMTCGMELELTADHMVFLDQRDLPVTGGSVQVGDKLKVVIATANEKNEEAEECGIVQRVSHAVPKQGFVTPITTSGTIVVNDIVASSYAGKHGSGFYQLQEKGGIAGVLLPHVHYHSVSHIAVAPLRFGCTWISDSLCREDLHYTQDQRGTAGQHMFLDVVHKLKHFVRVVPFCTHSCLQE